MCILSCCQVAADSAAWQHHGIYHPVTQERDPPMVCVKLANSVLAVFHLFEATKLPFFLD
jgi:hypothetical protein